MKTVSDILQYKGNQVYSVLPSALMFDALQIMSDKEIGALLVMEDDLIQGILSERDYARKVVLLGKSSKEIKVSEVMSEIVYYIRPNNTVEDCMAIMTEKRIRHLPVLENKKVAGMVSIGDVVKALIHDKNLVIDQLVNYIKGV